MEKEIVDRMVLKLKDIIVSEKNKRNYGNALKAIEICGDVLYQTNQTYTDEKLENEIREIERIIFEKNRLKEKNKMEYKKNVVLFYDGFGLDSRGLAQIYLKALCKMKKSRAVSEIIYVTQEKNKDNIPDIYHALESAGAVTVYIRDCSIIKQAVQLDQIVKTHKPGIMFFYTGPDDVAGAMVFMRYQGLAVRYQINLTDHAFWLGKNAFDICIEFRDYGASVSKNYRKIDEEKLVKLPFYPIVNEGQEFLGIPFPFDGQKQKIIFSGGSLYKTCGGENKYYQIVDHILRTYPEVVFWYAGSGDRTEMDRLVARFPGRVYLTEERKDLFQVLQHCYLYLSTYPICGGLMFQYAARAGKIPLTLKYDAVTDGFLLNQEELGIEFDSMGELYQELDRLMKDDQYRKEKEKMVNRSVLLPERFDHELQKLILEGNTSYGIHIKKINTDSFRKEYLDRLSRRDLWEMLVRRKGMFLFPYMPVEFMEGIFIKLYHKFIKRGGGGKQLFKRIRAVEF